DGEQGWTLRPPAPAPLPPRDFEGGPGLPVPALFGPAGGTPAYYQRASMWHNVPQSDSWTAAVLAVVQARRHDFEQARDVEAFCPGYAKATEAQRDVCWLRLVGSVVEFESSFKPHERPFCEGNGVYSVGLMALSTGECPDAMTTEQLQDPVANLTCGVNRMAKLIQRDHYIENADDSGACAYWSTLRAPHKAKLADGRVVTLGKRDEVIARTKQFNKF
ncbi:MAG: hypothetical protein ACXWTJ_22990, partial [Bdellovibrionota bacterium]